MEKNKKKKINRLLMKNRGQIEIIVVVAIIIILVVGGLLYYNNQKKITGQAITNLEKELEEQGQLTAEQERQLEDLAKVNCKDVQVPYDAQEEYTEQEPYSDEECEIKDLVYSITDFEISSNCVDYDERCIDYFLGICTEKETFCVDKRENFGLTLNNFDDEEGRWNMKFIMYGDGSEIDSKTQTIGLYPKGSSNLYWTFVLTGEEECKKKITGNYEILDYPTKTICETLTKYKTVTRYRTITKYRTETICE